MTMSEPCGEILHVRSILVSCRCLSMGRALLTIAVAILTIITYSDLKGQPSDSSDYLPYCLGAAGRLIYIHFRHIKSIILHSSQLVGAVLVVCIGIVVVSIICKFQLMKGKLFSLVS